MRSIASAGLWGCVLWFSAMAVAAEAPVPAADFARKPRYASVKISPDGDYLAVATPIEGQTALGFVDLKSRKLSGGLRFSRGESVAHYRWVSPRRIVASVARQAGPLDQPRGTGELFAVDADGTNHAYLFGYRGADQTGSRLKLVFKEHASAILVSPLLEDPDNVLVAIWPWSRKDGIMPSLERLNVRTGARSRQAIVPATWPLDVIADRQGRPRLAWGHDTRMELVLLVADDEARHWAPVPMAGPALHAIHLQGVAGDGLSAFFTVSLDSGRSCLRELTFASGSVRDLHCRDGSDAGSVRWAADLSRPVAINHWGARRETTLLDPEHPDARLYQALQKNFAGHEVDLVSQTQGGGKIVVYVSSDRNPGDYYLFDREQRKAEYLISNRPWIDPARMHPSTPIQYKARDGLEIHGYLTVAGGASSRQHPLVVMPHGGPHGIRDHWEWDAWAQFLASRGYAVLQPNFRGSGGYGVPFMRAGYRNWATHMQDDVTDGVRWAIAQGLADPGRICIVGASYGGYAALMGAMREPDLYRCAVGFAGVYDLVTQTEDSDTQESRYGRKYLAEVLGTSEAILVESSPVTHVARLKAPVLVAHGTADRRVPFSNAKALRKALDKHGKEYEWMPFEGEEHGFYKDENHEKFLLGLERFLDKHIGAGAKAPAAAGS